MSRRGEYIHRNTLASFSVLMISLQGINTCGYCGYRFPSYDPNITLHNIPNMIIDNSSSIEKGDPLTHEVTSTAILCLLCFLACSRLWICDLQIREKEQPPPYANEDHGLASGSSQRPQAAPLAENQSVSMTSIVFQPTTTQRVNDYALYSKNNAISGASEPTLFCAGVHNESVE